MEIVGLIKAMVAVAVLTFIAGIAWGRRMKEMEIERENEWLNKIDEHGKEK